MSKIVCVHPKINLLNTVADVIFEKNDMDNAYIIFTHKRAVSFFQYYISKKIDKPCFLPNAYSVEDWVKQLYLMNQIDVPVIINEYDQAWIIYEAAKEVFWDLGDNISSWDDFFPWALKLVKLFKEIDIELVDAKDIPHPPYENLSKLGQRLLEKLGRIYDTFSYKLKDKKVITYAKMIRFLAENQIQIPDSPFYFVGFYALTKAEDRLLKKIFDERETHIYWHADINDLPVLYKRWKNSWNVSLESLDIDNAPQTDMYFYEAHSLHAELEEIKRALPEKIEDTRPDKSAIVLVSPENLIPLIYHLPDGPINITMGYPLKLSGIALFLDSLFELILGKDEKKGYPLKLFLGFLKSPYFEKIPELEEKLEEYGAPYFDYEKLLNSMSDNLSKEALDYLKEIFENIILPVEKTSNISELINTLTDIFDMIKKSEDYQEVEQIFVDTLVESVFYPLKTSFFANVLMEKRGLLNLLKNLIATVSVPFEGEPLVGLQVMGILETRLLNFDEVFIFDVNEGILPNVEEVNPLMPQEIRVSLGLPDREKEEVITRYHFERLINSAKKIHILWQFQTNSGRDGGVDSIKVKSRYVERLLWDMEKKENKIFSEIGDFDKFKRSSFNILIKDGDLLRPNYLNKTIQKENIQNILKKISPSLLQQYINCPLEFFYSRFLKISTPQKIEEIKYDKLGTALHKTMELFYKELIKKSNIVTKNQVQQNKERLFEIFDEEIKKQSFFDIMSNERKFMLLKSVKFRLSKYIENHPVETRLLFLEKEFKRKITIVDIKDIELCGKIDRIDLRDNNYIILDYKTGYTNKVNIDKALKLDVRIYKEKNIFDYEVLKEIATKLPDFQLPMYVYLFAKEQEDNNNDIWDHTVAAHIRLRDTCKEEYFITPKKGIVDKKYRDWLRNDFIEIVKYVIRHILYSDYWYPSTKDGVCGYCDYAKMCRFAS